ncbi:putative bifunctional diguanylate cyclase/phosphodiesterase [Variovorax sp. PAMC 28711]|uniref:putative bifunctional diguanylate cyclase/phosphodiesterase n=1 Tax=Variovorax sp. PAMC 28711 TaxID=1795631 RepID=UPI001AEF54F6|nr:GGDEF domain-containing phosphodiesterase [Variovorax sp. PAMC 28711]
MAARLGADEFVLCFDALESHALDASVITDRLLSALNKPFSIGDQTVYLLSSAGLVTASNAFDDAESVLEHASLAMREAKRAGGARHVLYEPVMMDRAKQRGDLESDLRIALAEGQLFTVYQPIVDLADGSVAGMEALVRWRHPERGTVMPAEFIAVAEATGLIRELGDWVLNETCRQLVSWQMLLGDRSPRTVSVNLSRAQLADPGIVGRVADALSATRLLPVCLQLEVTESLAAQDAEVQARLKDLKQLGLTLALDDFGTGYSSLASLHDLPIDVVKIDRSFVCPVETSAHHRVLIESVVRVARSLGMSTVAEGIETACEAALLGALGCSKGQGYFYSTPLPAEEATAWLCAYRSPSVVLK